MLHISSTKRILESFNSFQLSFSLNSIKRGARGTFSFAGRPFLIYQNLVCLSKYNLARYLFFKHSSKQCILSTSLSLLYSSFYLLWAQTSALQLIPHFYSDMPEETIFCV